MNIKPTITINAKGKFCESCRFFNHYSKCELFLKDKWSETPLIRETYTKIVEGWRQVECYRWRRCDACLNAEKEYKKTVK